MRLAIIIFLLGYTVQGVGVIDVVPYWARVFILVEDQQQGIVDWWTEFATMALEAKWEWSEAEDEVFDLEELDINEFDKDERTALNNVEDEMLDIGMELFDCFDIAEFHAKYLAIEAFMNKEFGEGNWRLRQFEGMHVVCIYADEFSVDEYFEHKSVEETQSQFKSNFYAAIDEYMDRERIHEDHEPDIDPDDPDGIVGINVNYYLFGLRLFADRSLWNRIVISATVQNAYAETGLWTDDVYEAGRTINNTGYWTEYESIEIGRYLLQRLGIDPDLVYEKTVEMFAPNHILNDEEIFYVRIPDWGKLYTSYGEIYNIEPSISSLVDLPSYILESYLERVASGTGIITDAIKGHMSELFLSVNDLSHTFNSEGVSLKQPENCEEYLIQYTMLRWGFPNGLIHGNLGPHITWMDENAGHIQLPCDCLDACPDPYAPVTRRYSKDGIVHFETKKLNSDGSSYEHKESLLPDGAKIISEKWVRDGIEMQNATYSPPPVIIPTIYGGEDERTGGTVPGPTPVVYQIPASEPPLISPAVATDEKVLTDRSDGDTGESIRERKSRIPFSAVQPPELDSVAEVIAKPQQPSQNGECPASLVVKGTQFNRAVAERVDAGVIAVQGWETSKNGSQVLANLSGKTDGNPLLTTSAGFNSLPARPIPQDQPLGFDADEDTRPLLDGVPDLVDGNPALSAIIIKSSQLQMCLDVLNANGIYPLEWE